MAWQQATLQSITIFVGILGEAQQIETSQQQIPLSSKEEEEPPTHQHPLSVSMELLLELG